MTRDDLIAKAAAAESAEPPDIEDLERALVAGMEMVGRPGSIVP